MTSETHSVGFILLPRFQLLSFVLSTETLRIANKVAGRERFRWQSYSADGHAVTASSGLPVTPEDSLEQFTAKRDDPRLLLVCAAYEPLAGLNKTVAAALRRADRQGVMLGGLDSGSVVLAELGLLRGYRAALHWQAEAAFRERYPEIAIEEGGYVLDRDRLTSAGGMATADGLLAWLAQIEGADFAAKVARDLVHGRALDPSPTSSLDPALQLMRGHIEDPLPLERIAELTGLAPRKLQRRFKTAFGQSPAAYYLGLRLDHARDLLAGTELSVAEAGYASGFSAPAWFSRAYRRRFGLSPAAHRRVLRSRTGAGAYR